MKVYKIQNCRICNSRELTSSITLQNMPFTDEFVTKFTMSKEYLSNIEIGVCRKCGSFQNLNDTNMDDYYSEYTYTVQSSKFAMNFMSTLAKKIKETYFPNTNFSVLEIGSGSGEQLLEFNKIGCEVFGIEPSPKLANYANKIGVKTKIAFFDENSVDIFNDKKKKVDVVISSYTFDHIPRPVEVLKNIHLVMNEGGILVTEVHDLDLIFKRNEFCLFEHEHYTYLNNTTMKYLLESNGFEVLSFSLLANQEKRANSLLVVAKKNSLIKAVNVNVDIQLATYNELNKNISSAIVNFDNWLSKNSNIKIAAYGAGGRGIMTIAALKNFSNFEFILDKNPKSKNIFSPKTHIPVYGLDILNEKHVDKIVVFSFGYYTEIVEELCSKYSYKPEQFISILDIMS
jgi:SAM-dependent methyltransferase